MNALLDKLRALRREAGITATAAPTAPAHMPADLRRLLDLRAVPPALDEQLCQLILAATEG